MIKNSTHLFIAFAVFFCLNAYAGPGTIVFSKTSIDQVTGKTLPPATFNLGDNIYCRYYLKKDLTDLIYYSNDSKIYLHFMIGEKKLFEKVINMGGHTFEKTTEIFLNDNLNPEEMKFLNDLANGQHEITLKILVNDTFEKPQKLIAVGNFTLIKAEGNKMLKPKLGKTFGSLVEAKMTNPALEKEALKALANETNMKEIRGFDVKEKIVPLKIAIISEDWAINNNRKTGAVVGRYLDFAILVSKNGECFIKVMRMEQEYNGSGYQQSFGGYIGEAIIDNRYAAPIYHPLHRTEVDCE